MIHARKQFPNRTVTDPETGRTYPVPAGGSDTPPAGDGDGGDGDGDGDGGDDDDADGSDDGADGDGEDDDTGRAGGPEALRADLARERQKRKDEAARRRKAEKDLADARRGTESEVEKAAREAREAALTPAMRMARTTAIESAANRLGFRDVTDAIAGVDLDAVDVDEETFEVDRDTAVSLVTELAKAKPYLLTEEGAARIEGKSGTGRGGADTTSGNGSGKSSKSSTPQDSFMAALRGATGRSARV